MDGMGDVTVRRAVRADLAAVTALLEDADALHRDALPWLFRQVDEPLLLGFLEAFVSKADHAMFLAAAPDGSLAGVVYIFVREPSRAPIVEPAVVAEISALVVAPAFRRQRVGTHLVEAALRWAEDVGATRTELSVFEFNEPARAFWESLGFQTLYRRLVLQTGSRS